MSYSALYMLCITAMIVHFVYDIARTSIMNFVLILVGCWKSGPRSYIHRMYIVHTLIILCCSMYVTGNAVHKICQTPAVNIYTLLLHSYYHPFVFDMLYFLSLPPLFVSMSVSCLISLRSWIFQTVLNIVNIGIFCIHLNKKRAFGAMIVVCMGMLSATGLGFCLAIVLSALPRYFMKAFVDFECNAFVIPYIKYGGNDKGSRNVGCSALGDLTNQTASKLSCVVGTKRPVTKSTCDPPPPPKRGRKRNCINDGHKCGSCSIWLQTGSNKDLEKHHNMYITRHPNEQATAFTSFASINGKYQIHLRPDNCICNACSRDCI